MASHPAFRRHPILALNDTAFRSAPLDELMAQYGTAKGGGSCDNDFGMGLINRWKTAAEPYCTANAAAATSRSSSSSSSSSLTCHLIKQTKHHGYGDQLCLGRSVALSTKDFANEDVTGAVMQKYIDTKHMDAAYVHYSRGALRAAGCALDRSLWKAEAFPGWNVDWQKALEVVDAADAADGDPLACDVWVEEPTLLLQRDTFANFFHDSEDFFNAFIALAVLGWNTRDLRVVLADLYPKGPFWDLWGRVFFGGVPGREPLTAWDLKKRYAGKTVCFKQLALGILGAASPITVASWRTPCSATPLVRAYADYVVRGLGLHPQTHYAHGIVGGSSSSADGGMRPPKTVTVTYMARRASSQWPERKFCTPASAEASFFKCEDWGHLSDKRSLGRMIRNDKEVGDILYWFALAMPG